METLIVKTVTGSTMETIFDNCNTFSVRHFRALSLESGSNYNPNHKYEFEINVRHADNKNASVLFNKEVLKIEGLPVKKTSIKTKKQLTQFFEDNDFNVHELKEGKKKFAEIETWTDGGVNMIFTLSPFNVEEFKNAVKNFSVDDEIELHRQSANYKNAFTIKESLKDFEAFESKLNKMVEQLN